MGIDNENRQSESSGSRPLSEEKLSHLDVEIVNILPKWGDRCRLPWSWAGGPLMSNSWHGPRPQFSKLRENAYSLHISERFIIANVEDEESQWSVPERSLVFSENCSLLICGAFGFLVLFSSAGPRLCNDNFKSAYFPDLEPLTRGPNLSTVMKYYCQRYRKWGCTCWRKKSCEFNDSIQQYESGGGLINVVIASLSQDHHVTITVKSVY